MDKQTYLLSLVDDALAALETGHYNVTEERLRVLWDNLQEQGAYLIRPQSDYVRHSGAAWASAHSSPEDKA
jgi:hypothetical protein